MKYIELSFMCVCAFFMVGCSSPKQPAPVSEDTQTQETVATSEPADHHDTLSDKVAEIQKHLPLMVVDKEFQLKKVENDESEKVLTFYIFQDENVSGEWSESEVGEFGKSIVAWLIGAPEAKETLSSEEVEELKEYEDFQQFYNNIPNYEKVKDLLKTISDMDYSILLNFHSRDSYTIATTLTPEETKDAVIFYREILKKLDDDTSVDPF